MVTRGIDTTYIPSRNSKFSYSHIPYNLRYAVESLAFQFTWEKGVRGTVEWRGSIDGINWVSEIGNDCLSRTIEDINEGGTFIQPFPSPWLALAYLQFVWTPADQIGSEGNFTVSLRVCPGGGA